MKLTSKKAHQVIRYILINQEFTQRKIARETNVSLGYTNEVINYLKATGIVTKTTKNYLLWDKVKLLEKISLERPITTLVMDRLRLPTTTIQETENILARTLQDSDYAFTAFAGLRRYYEYHIGYPIIHLYIEDEARLGQIERGDGAIQVIALRPDLENIIYNRKKVNHIYVCDKIQIIIDLFSIGTGRDAAIKFLETL
jgi:hypothetical protein